jgi:hypothetical protein
MSIIGKVYEFLKIIINIYQMEIRNTFELKSERSCMLCLETSSKQLLKTFMSTESNLSSQDTCFFQVRNPFAPNKSTIPIVAHLRSLPGSATHAALINVFIYVPSTKSERARAHFPAIHRQHRRMRN